MQSIILYNSSLQENVSVNLESMVFKVILIVKQSHFA